MNWLHSSLSKIINADCPSPYRYDENEVLRIIAHPVNFQDFSNTIFNQSRTYIASDRNTTVHMISVLTELIIETKTQEQSEILKFHLESLCQTALELLESLADRTDVTKAYEEALSTITKKQSI